MIKSAPYYWAECDGFECGSRTPDSDIQAWPAPDYVFDYDDDWRTSDTGQHYCEDCWLYDDNDNIVFNTGVADQ